MRAAMQQRVKEQVASAAGQEAICAALMVNPRKRIAVDDFFLHRWVGGVSKEVNMKAAANPTARPTGGAAKQSWGADGHVGGDGGSGESKSGALDLDDIGATAVVEVDDGPSPSSVLDDMDDLPKISSLGKAGAGSSSLMRRSQSTGDLTSGHLGVAKHLVLPANSTSDPQKKSPRRLPPLDGAGGSPSPDRHGSRKKKGLRVNAMLANAHRAEGPSATNGEGKRSGGVQAREGTALADGRRVIEPLSPAVSHARKIVERGDAIFDSWATKDGVAGGGSAAPPTTPSPLGSPKRARSPLAASDGAPSF